MEEISGKHMPFSAEAEQSVLGSILIDPECLTEITNIIRAEDFYLKEHTEIFAAMQKLFLQSRTIDMVTLIDMLIQQGLYDENSSKEYIRLIIDSVPTAANIVDYAKIVREKSILRQLIRASEEITQTAYQAQGDVSVILDQSEQKIFSIAQSSITRDFVPINEVLGETYQYLQDLSNSGGKTVGVQTGFSDLDRVLVNLGPGDLVLVGARPGMGKTTFAMNVGTNVARRSGKAVCVFSLEMSAMQLVLRMIASEALVDSHKLRSGELDSDDWNRIAQTVSVLAECSIFIDDTTNITVTNMKAKLRRIKNLGFVVIDYLQLMRGETHTDNRVNEVGDISRNLKIMAKE
ncbi:MAG: replicative DNA helicase, partial [Eubacteriales bacterium]|nr:replicative DNA helicase [Eubacteriales bacterium]